MAGSNRYFLYAESANVQEARDLLDKHSIVYNENDAIQTGIKELSFTIEPNIANSIAQEVLNGNLKVSFLNTRLPITGSIGTIAATITASDMRVGSTDNTSANAAYLKVDSDANVLTKEQPTSRTASHSEVTVGATTTSALATNTSRKAALFINDSVETIYLKIGSSAVLNAGIRLNANGGSYQMSFKEGTLSTAQVNSICASGSKKLLVTEWV